MKTRNVIRDGQDRLGYVKPVAGLHDGLAFRFRMMLPDQVEELDAVIAKMPAVAYVEECANAIKGALSSWSEIEPDDKMTPITAYNIRRLPPPLFTAVLNIIQGRRAIDMPPEDTPERVEWARLFGIAAKAGEEVGTTVLRESEKN